MDSTGDIYAGACVFTCGSKSKLDLGYFFVLPNDLSNFSLCKRLHRTGILCGECEAGLKSPVFSYNLTCIDCSGHSATNWLMVIFVGFLPLTLFYLFVLVFNINVTSSHLHGVVFFSQLISMPQFVRILLLDVVSYPNITKLIKFTLPLYSIWNLDLFRSLFPHMCVNQY